MPELMQSEHRQSHLDKTFLLSEDVVSIAKDLLGCVIITRIEGVTCKAMITETEAYKAPDDRASHAFGNRRTMRTQTMFDDAGTAYIYLCYGIHHLFNIVTGPTGTAHAVLVRAVQPLDNIEVMMTRRNMLKPMPSLTAGPGRWTSAMGITTGLNATPLLDPESPIQLVKGQRSIPERNIGSSRRIGVDYAGDWAERPWRFFIRQNPWVSRHP